MVQTSLLWGEMVQAPCAHLRKACVCVYVWTTKPLMTAPTPFQLLFLLDFQSCLKSSGSSLLTLLRPIPRTSTSTALLKNKVRRHRVCSIPRKKLSIRL